jgi:hypothetical protein
MVDGSPHSPQVAFRLSPQQARLWSLHGPATGPFTGRSVLSVRGELNVEALRDAVRSVAARHEILRTGFDHPDGVPVPVQTVHAGREPEVLDGSTGGHGAGGPFPDGFDLRTDVPLRVEVQRTGDGEHRVTITVPALCADAEGLRALTDGIREAYAARTGPEAPPQIADVAEWAHQTAEPARTLRASLDLARPLAVRFPWAPDGAGATAADDFRPESLEVPLDRETAARLRELSGDADLGPRAPLLAAWTILLWRLAGRARVCVGVLHDGRDLEGLARVPGVLGRYLPLAPVLDARSSFLDTCSFLATPTACERHYYSQMSK